jgi:hypothetical protein
LGDILVFLIRDVASGPREFNMSPLCLFHTDVRTAMIYVHRLNRGGKGVWSPADSLTQGLNPSQLSWNYAYPSMAM